MSPAHAAIRPLRLSLMIGLATSLLQAPGSAQNAVFSSRVESVRVDVLVTDRGQPVRGLTAGDFEIFDEGVPQQVDLVSFDEIPLNVILALDMSSSVAGERLEHLRAACHTVLAQLRPSDQGALISFSHVVQLGAGLKADVGKVEHALAQAAPAGDTSLADGVYSAMMLGESDAGRALVIVFSDGLDTSSWLRPDAVLDTARRSDVVVYAVAVGRFKADFLRELTSLTGGHLYEVEKTSNLSAIFLKMIDEFRHRYLVSYTPHGVAGDGWHRLTVRVKRSGTVKARPGYLAGS